MPDPLEQASLERAQARGGADRSFLARLMRWFQSQGPEAQPASQDVADSMAQALPDPLTAYSAIQADRERKARLIPEDLFR